MLIFQTKGIIVFLLFFLIALFGWARSSWAAPAFVGYATNDVNNNGLHGTTDISYTVQHNGALLVVAASLSDTVTTTVASPGEAWTMDVHASNPMGDSLDIHSAVNVSAGPKTIHVSSLSSRAIRVVVVEYSGMTNTAPAAYKTSSNYGYSGTASAGSITTTIDNYILFTAARTDSDLQGWVAGSGYTMIDSCNAEQEPDQKLCVENRGPVAAGTYSGNFSINQDSWVAGLVAYKPAASSDTTPPSPPKNVKVN
jgi:hypothetical protein